ncbi:hypothetical protein [Amycolatopsis sp. cmx-11-51]|uniref:hypothetical protein n=1 Tax=unclassified Amycolatopsis TaxID=2618356 RepID=UPI0039E48B43
MRADRDVQLRWEPRTVTLDDDRGDQPETVTYPGIALARLHRGYLVHKMWLPVGDSEPTFADDEALITALRNAWRWSKSAA